MSKKLAVVISGAVSLGSFEAGVIYEVLEAIAKHNESLSENSENRIEIDVITGASAGGMTACILAQNLLYDDGSLRAPYENSLYKAWVEKVDIVPLLKVAKEDQHISLLNKGVVERIAAELLQDKEEPERTKHPAASSEIQIGVAMSNLNGFNYQIETSQNGPFAYTRFKDQFVCSVRREENGEAVLKEKNLREDDTKEKNLRKDDTWEDFRTIQWSDLREAGVSSGAFPLAFPMKSIFRVGSGKFYNRDSKKKNDENPDSVHKGNYLYTDGGVFENEPVGMAISLIDKAPKKEDNVTRYYLLVKPGKREPSQDPFLNQEENLLTTAIALFGAIFQQAQFQDWIMEKIDSPELLTITSNDSELIGDVFSAFSGFLEEKFRAYDYNIGRERAREQLKEAHRRRLLSFDPNEPDKMPAIEWKVVEVDDRGNRTLARWEDVKSKLGELAKEIRVDAKDKVIVDDQGDQWKKGKRSQLKELHRLMHEVKPETRKEICEQLKERLGSLVDFINDKYLAKADKQNPVGVNLNNLQFIRELIKSAKAAEFSDIDLDINFKLMAREAFGKPLAKIILVGVLDFWLEKNILNPP